MGWSLTSSLRGQRHADSLREPALPVRVVLPEQPRGLSVAELTSRSAEKPEENIAREAGANSGQGSLMPGCIGTAAGEEDEASRGRALSRGIKQLHFCVALADHYRSKVNTLPSDKKSVAPARVSGPEKLHASRSYDSRTKESGREPSSCARSQKRPIRLSASGACFLCLGKRANCGKKV